MTHARLCPNCRKLISNDESKCPYCGTSYPHFFLKRFLLKLVNIDDAITTIIMINVVMFGISIFINYSDIRLNINPLDFLAPGSKSLFFLGATGTVPIYNYGHWWTLLTANYLHGGLLHIIFNMIALNQVGTLIAKVFGVYRFWIIYTVSGVLGYFLSVIMNIQFTIGASAAVCGLIGAGCYFGKSQGGEYGHFIYHRLSGWIISLFLFGFLVNGINNWGHAGGLLGGILIAWLVGYDVQSKYQNIHRTFAIICIFSTALALLWGIGFAFYLKMIYHF
jgi:rhomboid protease GluP